MEALKKNKKIFFNIGLLVVFVWLLITSYSQSKRKPDNIGELLNDFSWLGGKWPKWLDLPLMNWINVGFKTLNEKYSFPSIIKVGAVNSALRNILYPTLKIFKTMEPRCKIQIIERSANYVVDSVLGGECDFGVNFTGLQEPGISFENLFIEDYVVVFPKGDPLEKKRKIKLSEIKNRDFISVWKGSGSRIYFENALALQKEDMDWTYEVRHIPSALNMVEQGLGITLAPKLAVSRDYTSLSYRPLIDPKVTRTMGLIKRSGKELSHDAQKLYDLLKSKYKK